jgi:hypothetical protein
MKVIEARNINDAWTKAKVLLNANHVIRPSRVGEVMECRDPVTTVYSNPTQRVLFNEERNANPIFHFMESMWMLAGRNDLAWIEKFNSKISDFVGKNPEVHGAYGYRWRKAFDMEGGAEDDYADQLIKIIRMLKKNPDERRAVLTMWNPLWDLERPTISDVPCNTQVYFKIRNNALDMVVTCRSNDVCMGAYGANLVHFSYLLEYMAGMIGIPIGRYFQVSDSWHAYTSRWKEFGGFNEVPTPDLYDIPGVVPYPLVQNPETFDSELYAWMERDDNLFEAEFDNGFFPSVAEPLWQAWELYKANDLDTALNVVNTCQAVDWRIACHAWLTRIKVKREQRAIGASK